MLKTPWSRRWLEKPLKNPFRKIENKNFLKELQPLKINGKNEGHSEEIADSKID